jgi:ParB family chromosome partitioning protein
VKITHGKTGRGRLTIQYGSLDQLDGILERLRS